MWISLTMPQLKVLILQTLISIGLFRIGRIVLDHVPAVSKHTGGEMKTKNALFWGGKSNFQIHAWVQLSNIFGFKLKVNEVK